ncbi:hypothetical protein ACQ4LE_008555 [Meloidogyne hapla]
MSQATPRKFSEKIAILERKQNEEQEQFNNVMRDVRTITSNDVQQQQRQNTPQSSPQQLLNYGPQSNDSTSKLSPEGPHPLTTNWNRAGGSLPNVHQMVIQQPTMGSTPPSPYSCAANNNYCWSPSWTNVQTAAAASNQFQQQQRAARTRSPGATHFHPYRNGTSPSGGHEAKMMEAGGLGGVHLQPPDPTWSKTRSDPAIHTNTSTTNPNLIDPTFLSYPFYSEVQNSWHSTNETPKMFNGPSTAPPTAQIQPSVLFFPSYPLAQTNMPLNQTNNSINQHQNRQQQQQPILPPNQIFNMPANSTIPLPSVSQTKQIGSPSCSSPNVSFSSQQNFMINNNGSPAPQQLIFLQQLNNNNANNNNFNTKTKMSQGNNEQQQQQLIMLENNRIALQQQQVYNTKISPPPPYFSQNIITNNNTLQQQQLTTPFSNLLSQTRSAPTSPTTLSSSSSMENYHPLAGIPGGKTMQGHINQWSQHRHFSASPDGMEVPNICVTGTDGSLDVDCFQDLQDLHLDSETLQMLKDQTDHENMVDPACETQLLS